MSFRNNTEAENYRLKAELEEKEKALKEATAKLNKLERDDELDELEKKLVKEPSWFARKLEEREQSKRLKEQAKFQERLRKAGTYRSSYGRRSRPFDWEVWGAVLFPGLVAFFIIFAICHSIYHYFYDFQSGTVVERERIPAHMNCSGTGKDHHCYWVSESYNLTIQNEQGETANWSVDSSDYHSHQQGDYFCYTDLFHDSDGCTPPTASERGFH